VSDVRDFLRGAVEFFLDLDKIVRRIFLGRASVDGLVPPHDCSLTLTRRSMLLGSFGVPQESLKQRHH
jgi:hypothetical protein